MLYFSSAYGRPRLDFVKKFTLEETIVEQEMGLEK
jgi:hypothetical protein